MSIKTVGAVVAMRKEVLPFIETAGVNIIKEEVCGYSVWKFSYAGKTVYTVESGIGEIQAAGATQMLINKFGAEIIINFGVCGSLTESLNLCNTVVVKGVVHYDFDLSAIDKTERGRYPQFFSTVINCDEIMINKALKFNKNLKTVICASADKFVADEKVKKELNKTYSAEICEMEAAGVVITAINNNVPFLILKAVSDGKGGAEEFMKMVNEASKSYVELVFKLLENL